MVPQVKTEKPKGWFKLTRERERADEDTIATWVLCRKQYMHPTPPPHPQPRLQLHCPFSPSAPSSHRLYIVRPTEKQKNSKSWPFSMESTFRLPWLMIRSRASTSLLRPSSLGSDSTNSHHPYPLLLIYLQQRH